MAASPAGAGPIRPLHALELLVDPGSEPRDTASAVRELALGWIAEALEVGRFPLPPEGGVVAPARGNRVELTVDGDRGGWLLRWSRADGPGPWDAGVRLRTGERGAEVALLVRGAEDGPAWRSVRRPGFAKALVDRHRCESAGLVVPPTATVLGDDDVGDLVEEVLLAPARALPVVMVSADAATGRPLADPDALADRLAGLARVFVLEEPRTSYELTRAVSDKVYSCFLGAVRLYLPGFHREADPYDHPLTLPERLRSLIARGGSAGDLLLAELMGRFPAWSRQGGAMSELLAAMPVREPRAPTPEREAAPRATLVRPPALAAAQAAAAATAGDTRPPTMASLMPRIVALVEENRALLEGIEALEARFDEFEEYQLALEEEQARLAGQVQEQGARVVELEARNRDLVRENAALRHELEAMGGGDPGSEPADLLDAVRRAARAFEDRLIFHPAAFASAEDSPYRHPGKAFRLLKALAEATEERRRSIEARASVGNLREHFEARGVEYKPNTSTFAKGQWAGHYQVLYAGRRVELDEHLALGGTHDPAGCLRIYFFWDEANHVYVVAHCGRHKPNTRT